MTKTQEIEILKEAAAKLGKDSYCGEWLNSLLPRIERDIRSDYVPVYTPEQAQKDAEKIVEEAKERAKEILDNASRNAQKIASDIENAKARARSELFRLAQNF